jgi:hypothetical protein
MKAYLILDQPAKLEVALHLEDGHQSGCTGAPKLVPAMHKADATSDANPSMANIPKSDIVFQRFKNLNNACLRRKQAGQNKGNKREIAH